MHLILFCSKNRSSSSNVGLINKFSKTNVNTINACNQCEECRDLAYETYYELKAIKLKSRSHLYKLKRNYIATIKYSPQHADTLGKEILQEQESTPIDHSYA